ncbi:DoxX family protein [Ornithinibacillus contaminans]|uniref:DoxX family protein n=1 Tax=Ornithinibacillus contaminans TaxID=694055 RepID=UPI00064DB734|nr:DoxX family protein [Ornithinibacillus contaminans]
MNIVLWVLQALLALMFISAGSTKLQYEKAGKSLPWVKDYSKGYIAFIGLAEVLGGIGLIIPLALGIAPILTPIAALGLALIMVLAIIFHIKRGEFKALGMNIIILAIALFIAINRF